MALETPDIAALKPTPQKDWKDILIKGTFLLLTFYLFFVVIELMVQGFNLMGKDLVSEIVVVTSNPFVAIFIGLLSSAIIQSSSTITAAVVAMVASGTLTLGNATYVIIGANVGTTLTSMIVAMTHISQNKEYKRAVAAAASHNIFNIISVVLFFPLEYYFHFLTKMATQATQWLPISDSNSKLEKISTELHLVKPAVDLIAGLLQNNPFLIVLLSLVLLFGAIRGFTMLIQRVFLGNAQKQLREVIFGSPSRSLISGIALTALVRSSSSTTALVVPMVATRKVSLKRAFDFILGANLGTTITAVLAAFDKSDAAVTIALVHVLFNLIGVVLFFPFSFIKNIPINLAKKLGAFCADNKVFGFIYIGVTFFLIPFILISVTNHEKEIQHIIYRSYEDGTQVSSIYTLVDSFDRNSGKGQKKKYPFEAGKAIAVTDVPLNTIDYVYEDAIYSENGRNYLLTLPGACDGPDSSRICLEKVLKEMKIDGEIYKSIYVYHITNPDSTITEAYFYPAGRLFLRKELLLTNGKKIVILELVKIKDE